MKENEEGKESQLVPPAPTCGTKPTRPGSSKPGDWSCRDGKWVWVENIGGD